MDSFTKAPDPEELRRRWEAQHQGARGRIYDSLEDMTPETLMGEALEAWVNLQSVLSAQTPQHQELVARWSLTARLRFRETLICPGCMPPAGKCQHHGEVGEWSRWFWSRYCAERAGTT